MAKAYSQALRDAMATGSVAVAILIDMETDPILRAWTWPGTLAFDGESYVSLEGEVDIQGSIKSTATLASEPLQITFDASRIRDDDHFVGQFGSSDWSQRKIRVRKAIINPAASPVEVIDVIDDWRGRMDKREVIRQINSPELLQLTCENGLFRIRGRNLHTRTHADQQQRLPGDTFYKNTAERIAVKPFWGKSPVNIPGATGVSGGSGHVYKGHDEWRNRS